MAKTKALSVGKRGRIAGSIGALLTIATTGMAAAPAYADLKICNSTPARLGVAIGYQDEKGWATEGWWNVSARSCETLLKDRIPSRFVYVYAVDYERGGEWSGDTVLCTGETAFLIRDRKDCRARGYQQAGFYLVDTGNATSWTIQLADPKPEAK